jgi:3-deoxy-D-manno-octulosonic-acid transferase
MIGRMFLLYEVLLRLVLFLGSPLFLVRRKYRANLRARLGRYRHEAKPHDLWIHAVSVGEALAAKPVVAEILRRRPETSIVITTTTVTGQEQARKLFPDATVTYFPLDFNASVRRFLDHHQPRVFATMETEIWPNATRLSRQRGLKLILANGRISDRSYPRYRILRPAIKRILRHYDRILAREQQDADRFVAIGAPRGVVEVSGNVKFDYLPDDRPLEIAPQLEQLIAGRPVIVFGSTMEGEDEALLPLTESLDAFLIVAPRKPERFDAVAALLANRRFIRRSAWRDEDADVLLLDTLGELARVYRYAAAAFIGGSLVATGGHNPIEAAAVGVPVCFGPHMSNFRDVAKAFVRAGAARIARTPQEVIAFADQMIRDAKWRAEISEKARAVVEQNRGAASRTAARIVELLP